MSAERKLGNLIPDFVNRLIGLATQPETLITKYPKAPGGTNAFFIALDGTYIQRDWIHYREYFSNFSSYVSGPREVIHIEREKRECEGGTCVDIFYRSLDKNGRKIAFVHTHVTGDDHVQFSIAMQNDVHIPIETGLNMIRERVVKLGITAPEGSTSTPNS